jgi:hypothetical protein
MIAMHDDEPSPDFVRFTEIEDVVVSAELVAHLRGFFPIAPNPLPLRALRPGTNFTL